MIVNLIAAGLVLAAWGALSLGLVVGVFTLLDYTVERVTGTPWLR